MVDVYDIKDDDYEEIRAVVKSLSRKMGPDALNLIEFSVAVGWKLIVSSPESVALRAPGDPCPKTIHLSARNKGKAPLRKMIGTIKRYGDPARVHVLKEAATGSPYEDGTFEALLAALTTMSDDFEVYLPKPKERFVEEKEVAIPKAPPVKAALPKEREQERNIVSEQPALMHYSLSTSGGKSYPSPTTNERKWSDGVIDYACSVKGCGKESDNRLAFRGAHYAMHVRKGEVPAFDMKALRSQVVDDPNYTEHAWERKTGIRDARSRALAALLAELDLKNLSADELAEKIMDWLAVQGGGGGGFNGEPLSDAQVLDRVRVLVDRGNYSAQADKIEDLGQQVEDTMIYAEQIEELAKSAEERAAKAEGTLAAFRDLVSELGESK